MKASVEFKSICAFVGFIIEISGGFAVTQGAVFL